MEQDKIDVSRKHFSLRIILLIIFIVIAVISLTTFIVLLVSNRTKSNNYIVSDSDYNKYASNYSCVFYLEGNNSEIKKQKEKINNAYFDTIKNAYVHLNSSSLEENYYGISYLNENINTDIKVNELTYNTLVDASKLAKDNNNYSLFSQPLYDFWDKIFYAVYAGDSYKSYDPYFNLDNLEYLNQLVKYINDSNHINIEFKDNNIINLHVSDEYKNFLNDYNGNKTYLSLNILYDSFVSDLVYEKFKSENLSNCYFLSDENAFLIKANVNYQIYSSKNDKVGYLSFSNYDIKFSKYFLYNLNDNLKTYYSFNVDNTLIYRHRYLNIKDGYPINNNYGLILLNSDNKKLIELNNINNENLISNSINLGDTYIKINNDNIDITKNLKDYFISLVNNQQINYL